MSLLREVPDHAIAMTCALLRNLHTGDAQVRGGGWSSRALGVFDVEPPPAGHIARTLPRTILTPHLAWLSPESEFASYEMAAQAIAVALSGQVPPHRVPPPPRQRAPE